MPGITAAPTYQFTVEEYLKLGEVGIFHEDDRVELLNGGIVVMSPIGVRHMNAVRRLNNYLGRRFGDRCLIDAQNPLVIDGRSMPQPDILLLRLDLDESRAPHPEDVLLLIEVADSSLIYDQTDKRDAYARSGIAEYWLLDLTSNEFHVFRNPQALSFQSLTVFRAGDSVAPLAFSGEPVAVSDLLPP